MTHLPTGTVGVLMCGPPLPPRLYPSSGVFQFNCIGTGIYLESPLLQGGLLDSVRLTYYLIFIVTLQSRHCYPHIAEEKTESQRSEVTSSETRNTRQSRDLNSYGNRKLMFIHSIFLAVTHSHSSDRVGKGLILRWGYLCNTFF